MAPWNEFNSLPDVTMVNKILSNMPWQHLLENEHHSEEGISGW